MQRLATLALFLVVTALTPPPAQAQWTNTSLSLARQGSCATHVDGKALFAGGRVGNALQDRVDIYDEPTGTWTTASLSLPRTYLAAASVGHMALFAGGGTSPTTSTKRVDVYDAQTGTWSTASLSVARFALSATSGGTKVIFAGGATGSLASPVFSDVVDIYDASLGAPSNTAAWSTATLSHARVGMGAATAGSKALFAGGFDATTGRAEVDIYDDSTGLWSVAALSQARAWASATGAGNRVCFAGGATAQNTVSGVVDLYDTTTGVWTTSTLAVPRSLSAMAAVGGLILIGGGIDATGNPLALVEVMDAGTGAWQPATELSEARIEVVATSVGTKALFAGGQSIAGVSAVVDVYDGLVPLTFCLGDGSGGACPCGNFGSAGRGCDNSAATGGAELLATGSPALSNDTLVLNVTGELPSAFTILVQGDAHLASPAFGDGLRCTGGALKRLYSRNASGGAVSAPQPGDPSISARAALLGDALGAGAVRYYQAYYRDPVLSFCVNGGSYNSSSALMVVWQP